ncbi:MAG TPA: hypothetical protein VFZ53_11480 [Polyangiaceae bacterium]
MSGKDSGDERDDKDDERKSEPPPDSEPPAPDSEPPGDDSPSSERDERARTLKSARPGKLGAKARHEEELNRAKKSGMMLAAGIGVVALAAGAAAGWFGHIEQGKAKIRAESTAGASSASPACQSWEKKLCAQTGEQSLACQQAKGASSLLTSSACDVALESVPATIAKVKTQRVPCDTLVGKLCKDLPEGSQTCGMVKERTPLFPPEKCTEMLGKYDQVLAEVKQLDQRPLGMSPHGGPQGAPHGADDGHGH